MPTRPLARWIIAVLVCLAPVPQYPAYGGGHRSPAEIPTGRDVFQWPLGPAPRVVRAFDPPPRPWLAGHRGVDLAAAGAAAVDADADAAANDNDGVAGPPVPGGVRVLSAGSGDVVFAGTIAGRGVVSVAHRNGLRTTYEPVVPLVHSGQRVVAGDVLGILVAGHPGCPVSACLHWGLRRGDIYLNPLALLRLGRFRLLPWDG